MCCAPSLRGGAWYGREVSGEEFSRAGRYLLASLMRLHDLDNDGALGRPEGEIALKALGLSDDEVYASLSLLDFSRDGLLQPAEVRLCAPEHSPCFFSFPPSCHTCKHAFGKERRRGRD